jgi:hypothetical protein
LQNLHLLNYIPYHADGTKIEINFKIQPNRSLLKCKSIFFLILWIAYLDIKSFETSINCPLIQFLHFFPQILCTNVFTILSSKLSQNWSHNCSRNCPRNWSRNGSKNCPLVLERFKLECFSFLTDLVNKCVGNNFTKLSSKLSSKLSLKI